MPLTPDSQLDLLFPAEAIPLEVKNALDKSLHVGVNLLLHYNPI